MTVELKKGKKTVCVQCNSGDVIDELWQEEAMYQSKKQWERW